MMRDVLKDIEQAITYKNSEYSPIARNTLRWCAEQARAALAADPGQAAERVQTIVQRAKDLIDNLPDTDKYDSREWAICDVGRYEALVDAVETLTTPGKGEE